MSAIAFVPETGFVEQNREPIQQVFDALAQDYPDRFVQVDSHEYSTAQALQIDDQHELTSAARRFLWVFAQGAQHGYDRGVQGKIPIDQDDVSRYMGLLGDINYGDYNLVTGGGTEVDAAGKNLLVGCGFPHLNAGRLAVAVIGNHEKLWEVSGLAMPTGQRPRWRDNPNERTSYTVIERTAAFTGLNLNSSHDQALLDAWMTQSPFARAQFALPEGQRFAFEADEARVALELGMLSVPGLFDFSDYPVIAHRDEQAEPLQWKGGVVPAREDAAYQYVAANGRSFWVVNAAAQKRIAPDGSESEPRPNGDSATREAYQFVGNEWQTHETIIATGAPHIRLGLDTAIRMVQMSGGVIKPLHLIAGHWGQEGEPPITGIANIVSTYKADKRARALLAGKNPDAPELTSL